MARRSSRLQEGDYYTITNKNNSSPMATISYYETPIRWARKSRVQATKENRLVPPFHQGQVPESGSTPQTRCSSRISRFFFNLFTHLHFSALYTKATTSHRSKVWALLLLLLLLPFCIWFLAPLLTITLANIPVSFGPTLQSSDMNLLLLYEMQERNALKVKATQSHLEHKVSDLEKQIMGFYTLITDLGHKIRSLEAQNLKLTEELQHLQQKREDDSLTSELQKDIEGMVRKVAEELGVPAGRHGCSECQRPIADRMADFALESQGASVIRSRCSQTYTSPSASLTLFGIPLWPLFRSPRTAIQGSPILAGMCWSFVGSEGTLAVRLSHPVKITHVTVDHLPRENSPFGDTTSAPKDLEVHGMKTQEGEGMFLGKFKYDKFGEPTQTFRLPNPPEQTFDVVELRVLSNWGQKEYTCLYRFRVHGRIDAS